MMSMLDQMPTELRLLCERWSKSMEEISGYEARLKFIREAFPDLLLNTTLFRVLLKNIIDGARYPDIRQGTMFDNEMLLYTDSKRLFSIRLYLWGRGEYTPIHDHNAWGLIGPVLGEFEVIKYTRQDEGSDEEYARLGEKERLVLNPGETDVTLPLNNGIHMTGNPTDKTLATIHLYGNPVRRTYINTYDIQSGRISRLYAPRSRKRILASEALRTLEAQHTSGG
jgi:predicted metal-dependent enzyme (double-stranded beta helix superfamily)